MKRQCIMSDTEHLPLSVHASYSIDGPTYRYYRIDNYEDGIDIPLKVNRDGTATIYGQTMDYYKALDILIKTLKERFKL